MAIFDCDLHVDSSGREQLQYIDLRLPVACYIDNLDVDLVPWHWHEELELFWVDHGCATYALDDQKFTIHAGEGVMANSGVLHSDWKLGSQSCQGRSVLFHPRLVGGAAGSVYWQKYVQPLLNATDFKGVKLEPGSDWRGEILRCAWQTWQNCKKETPGYEFAVRDDLSRIVFQLCRHLPEASSATSPRRQRDERRLKQMLQYMQQDLSRPLTVAEIAQSAAISPSECLRCFKVVIGAPPLQYLNQLRLQRAAERLTVSDDKVARIAQECGFREMSYFARQFRRQYGTTPSQYRREHGGTPE